MKIVLYQPGGVTIDVTPHLLQDEQPELNQEFERAKWEWTVDSINLKLSDRLRTFTNAFKGTTKQTKWWLDVYGDAWDTATKSGVESSRLLFQGMLDPPTIKLTPLNRVAAFSAFPLERYLWDKLEQIKVRRAITERTHSGGGFAQNLLISFPLLLRRELISTHRLDKEGLITDVSPDAEYFTHMIRDNYTDPTGTYPNDGLFCLIDPGMTWAQFLQQCSVYYNAAFYIDRDTRELKMKKRNNVTAVDVRIADDLISEKSELEVQIVDEGQIDYAGSFMEMAVQAPTLNWKQHYFEDYNPFTTERIPAGTVGWAMTGTIDGKEDLVSKPLLVELTDYSAAGFVSTYEVSLKIGACQAGTTQRALYRFHSTTAHLGYRKMLVIPGNAVVDITDRMPLLPNIVDADVLPTGTNNAKTWMKYTVAGGWELPILDPNGNNTPPGAVQDITPQIQFTESSNPDSLLAMDGGRVFHFFGSEMTPQQFVKQYEDLFMTKRRVRCRLKGTDYRLGDRIRFIKVYGLEGVDLVIRKARNLFFERETEMELLEI
jgi:hypothetical protein